MQFMSRLSQIEDSRVSQPTDNDMVESMTIETNIARIGRQCSKFTTTVKGYLWVGGGYLWVQGGYLSVLGGYVGGSVGRWVVRSGGWEGQVGGQVGQVGG